VKLEFVLTTDGGEKYTGTVDLMPTKGAFYLDDGSESHNRETRALPEHILDLRSGGLFTEPRTPAEVHSMLQKTYRCEQERVKVALLRLQRRRELRKTSKICDGRERVAYVW
jgi:hypothetical protein